MARGVSAPLGILFPLSLCSKDALSFRCSPGKEQILQAGHVLEVSYPAQVVYRAVVILISSDDNLLCLFCCSFRRVPVTSISDDHEEANEDNPSKLIQYLPKFALTLFFPPSEGTEIPTVGESIDYMVTSKEAPVVSVYIVPGTDSKANLKLQKLFERYPVRVTFLQSIDFYPASSLPFESMSHHNLAAVRGAMPLPALIIESGDLLTMTIVDKSGQIVGGNTALGLYSQLSLAFQNLGESVGPEFNASNLMDNLLNRKEPLDKTNPVDVVLDGVLQPLLLSMISTLKNFAEKYAGSIFIHGMNGNVLHSLMERVQLTKISADLASNSIPTVTFDDHLVHRGIANTLVRYDTSVLPGSDREKYLHLIGQRVARSFSQDVEDSIYRGVISCAIAVKDGSAWDDHLFEIIYDDGDREELDVIELYGKSSYCFISMNEWTMPQSVHLF